MDQTVRPSRSEVEAAFRTIIRWTGDNPDRDGLHETPARLARAYERDADKRRRYAIISVAALDGIFLQWLLDPDAIDLESLHGELRSLSEGARLLDRT